MKKKNIAIVIATIMALSMVGCGNMSIGPGNFEFKKIHVDTYHQNECFTIEKWYENNTGIEVKTKEAGTMYFSEGQYILIEDTCPFCESTKE